MTPAGLAVEALSRRYGNRQILRDLSFSVGAGEFIAVMGEPVLENPRSSI